MKRVKVVIGEKPDILHLSIESLFGTEHTIGRFLPDENTLLLFCWYAKYLPNALLALNKYYIAHKPLMAIQGGLYIQVKYSV